MSCCQKSSSTLHHRHSHASHGSSATTTTTSIPSLGTNPSARASKTNIPSSSWRDYPALAARTVQNTFLPSILFTEGYKVFRDNFGLSKKFWMNNVLLAGMAACSASKLWINPWFDLKHEALNEAWNSVEKKDISDQTFYSDFYSSITVFMGSLVIHILVEQVNSFLEFLLSTAITTQKQKSFINRWLSNSSAYGVNLSKEISGTQEDDEKANLNPYKLIHDIENENALLKLWNTRINTVIDFATAFMTLAAISPPMVLRLASLSTTLPMLFVASIAYSMVFNVIMSLIEIPMERSFQKMNQIKDLLIHKVTGIDTHSELINFLDGEKYEEKELLKLLNKRQQNAKHYQVLQFWKENILHVIKHSEWLIPILFALKEVRQGLMKKSQMGPAMHNFMHVNEFFTWSKDNFDLLVHIRESIRRLALFEERMEVWRKKVEEIEKRVTDSDTVTFSGKIYADEQHETLLAQGKLRLEPASITHFDAPSGTGKTTLFRLLRRMWPNFHGDCSVPKAQSVFLPSQVYVLGANEPLFQTVSYPEEHFKQAHNLRQVQDWFKDLNLPDHISAGLAQLSEAKLDHIDEITANNWLVSLSDGERKRIAFTNVLLKLHSKQVKFLVLDEPFKGIDIRTQRVMVDLLREAVGDSTPSNGCTVIYSNHEQNHDLNTHSLTVDSETKQFRLSEVSNT